MTVCLAAIYNNNSILGVSDRMITAGDIEFERSQSKIIPITTSISIMTAGDTNIQTQILLKVTNEVSNRIIAQPDKWIPVEDIAKFYRNSYVALKMDAIENQILKPYGLNYDTYISRQKSMSTDFLDNINLRIQRFFIPNIASIVTGIDDTGAHIFIVKNEDISCHDMIGFASVGIGSNHALSHFMLSSYTRSATEAKALLTIHQAKKKSEVSPGVGEETDMFVSGPNLGTFTKIEPLPDLNIIKDLDTFYKVYVARVKKQDKQFENKIKNYLDNLPTKTQPQHEFSTETPIPAPKVKFKKLKTKK